MALRAVVFSSANPRAFLPLELQHFGQLGRGVCRQALLVVRHRLARAARPWRCSMAVELGD